MNKKAWTWGKNSGYYKEVAAQMPAVKRLNGKNVIFQMWVDSISNFTTNPADNTVWVNANLTFRFMDEIDHPT